jgi:hypothetical protein
VVRSLATSAFEISRVDPLLDYLGRNATIGSAGDGGAVAESIGAALAVGAAAEGTAFTGGTALKDATLCGEGLTTVAMVEILWRCAAPSDLGWDRNIASVKTTIAVTATPATATAAAAASRRFTRAGEPPVSLNEGLPSAVGIFGAEAGTPSEAVAVAFGSSVTGVACSSMGAAIAGWSAGNAASLGANACTSADHELGGETVGDATVAGTAGQPSRVVEARVPAYPPPLRGSASGLRRRSMGAHRGDLANRSATRSSNSMAALDGARAAAPATESRAEEEC